MLNQLLNDPTTRSPGAPATQPPDRPYGIGLHVIDARTVTAHSPAIMQDELRIGNFPHLCNIVILKRFPFSESCRNSDLISYTKLHRRGNEHLPTYP
jgi:hypothetical protein